MQIKFKNLKTNSIACIVFLWNINNAFAANGYWFNLYCEAPDGRTLSTICKPAIEGQWEYYGGSFNYGYIGAYLPKYKSMDEVSRAMESYIDAKFNYCRPAKVSSAGPAILSINNGGLVQYNHPMSIAVGMESGSMCDVISSTYSNSYTQEKQFSCPSGAQGPFKNDDDDYRFCAYPQKFKIDISGPSETQALPSLMGPIKQTVTVVGDNVPAKKWGVQIKIIDEKGVTSYGGGSTNEQGIYEFLYVPPVAQASRVDLSATCSNCETVSKSITVLPTDFQITDESLMCRR